MPGVDVAKLVFVIKEAFYKAYYPATLQFLDFPDARVELSPDRHAFAVNLTDPGHPSIEDKQRTAGRWSMARSHIIAIGRVETRIDGQGRPGLTVPFRSLSPLVVRQELAQHGDLNAVALGVSAGGRPSGRNRWRS